MASALLAGVFFCSCESEAEGKLEDPGQSRKAGNSVPVYQELLVAVREDGLAYQSGAEVPFSGDAIELYHDRTPPRLASRTPYVKGRRHGVAISFTRGGKLREERTFELGLPTYLVVYHGNGQKKFQMALNERGFGEGPILRWYDNGVLWSEGYLDDEGRFHGIEKDYDREGKLAGHYRKEHGVLKEILFETPAMADERRLNEKPAASPVP